MKTTLYAAMSANGMIAAQDGDEEFLSDTHWKTFCALARETGNFIVGRKALEAVRGWANGLSFDALKGVEKIILSQDGEFDPGVGYLAAASPKAALALLAKKGHANALVAGGAQVNAAFVKAGLVNKIILSIEPAIVGKGVPAFAPEDFNLTLKRLSTKASKEGIVRIEYEVV